MRVAFRRLVFAKIADRMMNLAGIPIVEKYTIAGYAMKLIDRIPFNAFAKTTLEIGAPRNNRAIALALLLHAAAMALDHAAERALRSVVFKCGGTLPVDINDAGSHILKMQGNEWRL